MELDVSQRSVRLSVGELATFRNLPSPSSHGTNPWRAVVGQQWHKSTENLVKTEQPGANFEVNVSVDWRHSDWLFQLNGRIDQLLPTKEGALVREVKTTRRHLPTPDETLLADYPAYFAQAASYRAMLEVLPEYNGQLITAEVQFINIENGAIQSVSLESSENIFERQLDQLVPFLDERLGSLNRLHKAQIRPAFDTLRVGQTELFQTLQNAALQSRHVLAQAPTGFGKTGIVLEHALKHMQNGLYERCIYLSSKSTGQLETIRQLKIMIGHDLRYIQMRNRNEHRIDSERHTCTGDMRCDDELGQNWREADIRASELFENGTVELSRAQEIGTNTGICPYSLTKACLPFSEIWIGDSNYVFSPDSRAVFMEARGFEPGRTLLIVDEAHNLPDRTAESLSLEIASADLLLAIEELRAHGVPRRLLGPATELCRWIDSLSPKLALTGNQFYTGQDLCEDFSEQLKRSTFDYDATAPFAIKLLRSIPKLSETLSLYSQQYLHWVPRSGVFAATCLDASEWIAECLKLFGGSIMMSATLSPFKSYRESCGLDKESVTIAQAQTPWRDDAYDVAIDCRIDTRLSKRESHYETTALTIVELIQHNAGGAIAVFFASYLYAENIQAYIEALAPELRIKRQPRGVDLAEQSIFINEGLLIADALFLILGSSYAEGIDQLGGRVKQIMIVGPALPEVNLLQKKKMEDHPSLSQDEAFRDIYIRPAMRRIHQALGRIVRAPGHTARVLLHCKRFAEDAYQSELAPEYQSDCQLLRDEDFFRWLNSSKSSSQIM